MPPTSSADTLDAVALTRLKLSRPPFGPAGKDFLFADAAHRTQVNVALHMLQASERVLVVSGETGIGKTTFFLSLARHEAPELAFASAAGDRTATIASICSAFLRGLGLNDETELATAGFLKSLWDFGSKGRRPVLLLDDADQLPYGVLSSLFALWEKSAEDGAPFGLVLAVQRGFEARMISPERRLITPEQIHVINLYPFSEHQTGDYIRQCLQAAGGEASLLSAAEIRQIHVRSKGIPAAINREALRVLKAKAQVPFKLSFAAITKGRTPLIAAAAVGGLAIAVLLKVLLSADPTPDREIELTLKPPSEPTPYGIPIPQRYDYGLPFAGQETDDDEDLAAETETEVETEPSGALTAEATPADEVAADYAEEPPSLKSQAGTDSTPPAEEEPVEVEAVAEATEPQPAVSVTQEEPAATTPAVATPAVSAPAPVSVAQPRSTATPAPAPTKAATPGSEPDPFVRQLAENKRWVTSRNPSRMTIQLLAAHDRESLKTFVAEQDPRLGARIVRTKREGRDWYVVLSGDYPDFASAAQALRALPAPLRQRGAWVRSFESLHQTLPAD